MELSLKDAWADFIYYLHHSKVWETLSREERQYLDKINRGIKRGNNPVRQVYSAFERYRPGVYVLSEIIFFKRMP